MKLLTKHSQRL